VLVDELEDDCSGDRHQRKRGTSPAAPRLPPQQHVGAAKNPDALGWDWPVHGGGDPRRGSASSPPLYVHRKKAAAKFFESKQEEERECFA
jgi:hypothetical protein